jgi:nicotinate-nucleotide pyrophosphorylase
MGIIDYINDHKSQKTFAEVQSQAEKMFTSQKEALKAIADTTGYAEIVRFWQSEKEAATQRIITAKKDDPTARAMFALSDRFLKFLDARIKS